jgi:DNA-binding transcriptional LysR family regulator
MSFSIMENAKFSWEDLRVLLAVSRGASCLAAGRALGLSTSTVARRISVLETHFGAQLVRRGSAGTALEPAASALVQLAERIESELAVTARDLSAEPERFAGVVRLSVGEGFVRFAARVAAAFRRDHPETLIELVADQRLADLPKREADLALRTVKSSSATVISRKLGELRYGCYASDEYLHRSRSVRVGRNDFAAHSFVIYEGVLEGQPEIRWLRARGAVRFPFRASNTDSLIEAAIAGQGIAALPVLLAEAAPELRRLALDEDPPNKPVYLAMHRDMRRVPRVRALADWVAAEAVRTLAATGAAFRHR